MSTNPNNVITVNLDPGTWQWLQLSIWVAVALTITVVAVVVFHMVSEFRTPLESKGIRKSSHSHKSGMLLADDDGYMDWELPDRSGGESYIETKKKGRWKFHHVAMLPRQGSVSEEITVADGKDLSKTRSMAEQINRWNATKVYLRGAKVPVWIGVRSKGILMSVRAIAGIQLLEEEEKAFNSNQANKDEVFPIDVHAVKQMVFKASYNESALRGMQSDSEHIGEERAKKGEGLNKIVIIAGIAFAAVGVVALAIAAFIS